MSKWDWFWSHYYNFQDHYKIKLKKVRFYRTDDCEDGDEAGYSG